MIEESLNFFRKSLLLSYQVSIRLKAIIVGTTCYKSSLLLLMF